MINSLMNFLTFSFGVLCGAWAYSFFGIVNPGVIFGIIICSFAYEFILIPWG